MKLKIKTNFSFQKLSSSFKKIRNNLIESSVVEEAIQMRKRLSAGKTVSGSPMEQIKDSTRLVRSLRKQPIGNPPLNASGALKNSITAQKKGINFKKYGIYHNEGYRVTTNPIIPSKGKSVPSGHKRKKFFFKGKSVPARQWIHDDKTYSVDKEIVNELFSEVNKALKK